MQHLQKTGGGGPHLAHPKRMPVLSPPTAEEPTHGSDHVGKDSSPASLFCRSLHQECFTTLLQSTASSLFLRIAGCHPTIPILERFQQSRCKGPLLSALPLRTQRLCVILFRSSLLFPLLRYTG